MNLDSVKNRVPSKKKLGLYGGSFLVFLLIFGLIATIPSLGEITVYGESTDEDGDQPTLILGGTVDATIWEMALADFRGCDTPANSDQEINCEVHWSSIVPLGDEEPEDEDGDVLETPPEPEPEEY